MIFALLLRKPANGDDEIAKEIVKETSFPRELLVTISEELKKPLPPLPPSRNILEIQRKKRRMNQRTQKFIQDTFFYLLFLGLAFFTIYSMQDLRAYSKTIYTQNLF